MRFLSIVIAGLNTFLVSNAICGPPINAFPPLSIITNKSASDSDLLMALMKLSPKPDEGALFWSQIANDPTYGHKQRLLCIDQLFKRYVPIGTRLDELQVILNDPKWIQTEHIKRIKAMAGAIPLGSFDGSVFQLWTFFPGPVESSGGIFIRVSGDVDEKSFIKVILGGKVDKKVLRSVVREIGFF